MGASGGPIPGQGRASKNVFPSGCRRASQRCGPSVALPCRLVCGNASRDFESDPRKGDTNLPENIAHTKPHWEGGGRKGGLDPWEGVRWGPAAVQFLAKDGPQKCVSIQKSTSHVGARSHGDAGVGAIDSTHDSGQSPHDCAIKRILNSFCTTSDSF